MVYPSHEEDPQNKSLNLRWEWVCSVTEYCYQEVLYRNGCRYVTRWHHYSTLNSVVHPISRIEWPENRDWSDGSSVREYSNRILPRWVMYLLSRSADQDRIPSMYRHAIRSPSHLREWRRTEGLWCSEIDSEIQPDWTESDNRTRSIVLRAWHQAPPQEDLTSLHEI